MSRLRLLGVLVAVVATLSGCLRASTSAPTGTDVDTGGQPSLPLAVPGVAGCDTILQQAEPGSEGEPERLPALALPCLTKGPDVEIARLGGRPTVVNLWATWCVPCRREMPALEAAHVRHPDVQFLGVDTKDRNDWAQEFLPLVKVGYPQVVDTDGRLLAALRSPGLPVTVVLDRSGRVVGRQIGAISDSRLAQLIAAARG